MIIAVNITLDIGLLTDEFRKFASKTTLSNVKNSQWEGQRGGCGLTLRGMCGERNCICEAGQELLSKATPRARPGLCVHCGLQPGAVHKRGGAQSPVHGETPYRL